MTAQYADFKELMTLQLIDFVQSQASVLSGDEEPATVAYARLDHPS
jgi:hypothetical protein